MLHHQFLPQHYFGTDTYNAPKTLDDAAFHPTHEFQGTLYNAKYTLSDKDKGDLTKVVHNRKYMDESPSIDTSDLKDEDLHDWKLVGKVVSLRWKRTDMQIHLQH